MWSVIGGIALKGLELFLLKKKADREVMEQFFKFVDTIHSRQLAPVRGLKAYQDQIKKLKEEGNGQARPG